MILTQLFVRIAHSNPEKGAGEWTLLLGLACATGVVDLASLDTLVLWNSTLTGANSHLETGPWKEVRIPHCAWDHCHAKVESFWLWDLVYCEETANPAPEVTFLIKEVLIKIWKVSTNLTQKKMICLENNHSRQDQSERSGGPPCLSLLEFTCICHSASCWRLQNAICNWLRRSGPEQSYKVVNRAIRCRSATIYCVRNKSSQ